MIRLSKLTDYAIVLLAQIARQDGRVATTTALSLTTGLPHPTVSKVLKILARGGLLHAHRGAAGGYTLTRDSGEITIAAIVTVMDGPIALTDCVDGAHQSCGIQKACPMNGHWNRINRVVHNALSEVSLKEIAMDVPAFMKMPARAPARAAKG